MLAQRVQLHTGLLCMISSRVHICDDIMPAMWPFPGNCTVGIALGIYEFDETGNIRIQ